MFAGGVSQAASSSRDISTAGRYSEHLARTSKIQLHGNVSDCVVAGTTSTVPKSLANIFLGSLIFVQWSAHDNVITQTRSDHLCIIYHSARSCCSSTSSMNVQNLWIHTKILTDQGGLRLRSEKSASHKTSWILFSLKISMNDRSTSGCALQREVWLWAHVSTSKRYTNLPRGLSRIGILTRGLGLSSSGRWQKKEFSSTWLVDCYK